MKSGSTASTGTLHVEKNQRWERVKDLIDQLSESDLLAFVDKIESKDDCDLWTGELSATGIPRFRVGDKVYSALRVSAELLDGRSDENMRILPCEANRTCVRPEHIIVIVPPPTSKKRRTHCPKGHPYTKKNTIKFKDGRRSCRLCRYSHWGDRAQDILEAEAWSED